MGTTGSAKQTWALMNGGRSGLFDRDRSKDYFFMPDNVATLATAVPDAIGALNALAQQTSLPSTDTGSSGSSSNINPNTGRAWTDDELADYVAGSEPGVNSDAMFYQGGLGLPSWAAGLGKTATSIGGTLAGVPSPISSVAGGLLGAGLGEEGLNAHTGANVVLDTLLGLNPVTGMINLAGKLGAKALGNDWDIASAIGKLTDNYSIQSPRDLNLNLFDNDSAEAFKGYNQPTLAEITRQEAANRREHSDFTDQYLRAQDEAMAARQAEAAAQQAAAQQAAAEAAQQAAAQQAAAEAAQQAAVEAAARRAAEVTVSPLQAFANNYDAYRAYTDSGSSSTYSPSNGSVGSNNTYSGSGYGNSAGPGSNYSSPASSGDD